MNRFATTAIAVLLSASTMILGVVGYGLNRQIQIDATLGLLTEQIGAMRIGAPIPAPPSISGRGDFSEALVQGKKRLADGDIGTAALYFRNAIGLSNGDSGVLAQYVGAVADWSRSRADAGDFVGASTLLDDLQAVVADRASSSPITGVSALAEMLKAVQAAKADVEAKRLAADKTAEETRQARALEAGRQALARELPTDTAAIDAYVEELSALRSALEPVSHDAAHAGAESMVTKISEQLRRVELRRDAFNAVRRLAETLNVLDRDKSLTPYVQRMLLTVDTDVQALAHSEAVADTEVASRLKELAAQFDATRDTIAKRESDALWAATETMRAELAAELAKPVKTDGEVQPDGSIQKRMERLVNLRQGIASQLAGIGDQTRIDELRALLAKVDQLLNALQREQARHYDVWAIKLLKRLNESVIAESSVVDSIVSRHSVKIRDIVTKALTSVDSRYLSVPAGRVYSEVLDAGMRKLTDDDRIGLSADLTVSEKQSPMSF